jgi:beta-glucosidase
MFLSLVPVAVLLVPALAVVQPLNATVFGPYGNSPPVYPSRKSPLLS